MERAGNRKDNNKKKSCKGLFGGRVFLITRVCLDFEAWVVVGLSTVVGGGRLSSSSFPPNLTDDEKMNPPAVCLSHDQLLIGK